MFHILALCVFIARFSHQNDIKWAARHVNSLLFSSVFRLTSNKTSKPALLVSCEGNPPMTSDFLPQRVSNAESVSISWRHRDQNAHLHLSSLDIELPGLFWCQLIMPNEHVIQGKDSPFLWISPLIAPEGEVRGPRGDILCSRSHVLCRTHRTTIYIEVNGFKWLPWEEHMMPFRHAIKPGLGHIIMSVVMNFDCKIIPSRTLIERQTSGIWIECTPIKDHDSSHPICIRF